MEITFTVTHYVSLHSILFQNKRNIIVGVSYFVVYMRLGDLKYSDTRFEQHLFSNGP